MHPTGVQRFAAAEKKLREAWFFLGKIDAARTTSDPEVSEAVDFYLSALLAATRSVYQVLNTEFGRTFFNWCDDWRKALAQHNRDTFDAIRSGRNHCLKEGTQPTRQNYLVSGPQYPPELQFLFEEGFPVMPREFWGQISPTEHEQEIVTRGRECIELTTRMLEEFRGFVVT